VCVCVRVCVSWIGCMTWSCSQGNTQPPHCYDSVQMRDGSCVHTARKTHFQRRISVFNPPPRLPLGSRYKRVDSNVEIPKHWEQKYCKSCLAFHKVLQSNPLPITFILSPRIKVFVIKPFRLMSWFMPGRKITGNPGRDFCTFKCFKKND